MSAGSQWAVRTAVMGRLSASPGLAALLSGGADGIYDHVPKDSGFPYLVIGEAVSRPFGTQDMDGAELTLRIHAWSRYEGEKEISEIMGAVRDALDGADFALSGHRLVLCRFSGGETRRAPDGRTRQGTQAFRIITEPAAS